MLLVVATLAFVLLHAAPGDPLDGNDLTRLTAEARERWRVAWGLDRPLPEQYARWLLALARGEMGWSLSLRRPVAGAIAAALPNTLLLMGVAVPLGFALGAWLGAAQGHRPRSLADRVVSAAGVAVVAVPPFTLALLLLLLLAYRWPVLPPGGVVDPVLHDYMGTGGRLLDRLRHLVLPVLALVPGVAVVVARHQRAAVIEAGLEPWVRAARSRGLPERTVRRRYTTRLALGPLVTLAGLALPALAGGAMLVEHVFAWPGMGRLAVGAVLSRDHPLALGVLVVTSAVVVAGSFLADVVGTWLDPRLRDERP